MKPLKVFPDDCRKERIIALLNWSDYVHRKFLLRIPPADIPQQLPEECRPCSNLSPGQGWRRWTERLCTFNQGYRSLSSHRSVNIAQQNCISHGDFLSNAEPSRAFSEKTSWCTTTRRSRIWFRIWFLPEHRSDNERKDTSAKMRSKLPTQALPSKFYSHPKNRVQTPPQKMPTYVPKEKNTLKVLESTGWLQYSHRMALALQKYFSK